MTQRGAKKAAAPNVALLISTLHGYSRAVLHGVRQFANQQRREWILYAVPLRLHDIHTLIERKIDAAIIQGPSGLLAGIEHLNNFPIVRVIDEPDSDPAPSIRIDQMACGATAAEHLLERGLRHFASVDYEDNQWEQKMRGEGFVHRLKENGYSCIVHLREPMGHRGVLPWDVQRSAAFDAWLQSLPKPIGIFCFDDLQAGDTAIACQSLGLRVPEDIAIIGAGNDLLICEMTHPNLSSVDFNWQKFGYEAAAALDRMLRGQTSKPALRIGPTGVVTRRSTDIMFVEDPDVRTALQFIRTHFGEMISTDDVVEAVTLGRRTLDRRFRLARGHSVHDEIQAVRIEKAKELLVHSDLPMAQIALKTGFASAHWFSTAFRSAVKQSPNSYRLSFRTSSGRA